MPANEDYSTITNVGHADKLSADLTVHKFVQITTAITQMSSVSKRENVNILHDMFIPYIYKNDRYYLAVGECMHSSSDGSINVIFC